MFIPLELRILICKRVWFYLMLLRFQEYLTMMSLATTWAPMVIFSGVSSQEASEILWISVWPDNSPSVNLTWEVRTLGSCNLKWQNKPFFYFYCVFKKWRTFWIDVVQTSPGDHQRRLRLWQRFLRSLMLMWFQKGFRKPTIEWRLETIFRMMLLHSYKRCRIKTRTKK